MVGPGRLRDLFSLLLGLAHFLPVLLRGMNTWLQPHTTPLLQLFSLMLPPRHEYPTGDKRPPDITGKGGQE